MSEQPDLFQYARAPRRSIAYRETSRQALRQIAAVSGELDRLIVAALRTHGPLIDQEIERIIGRSHQAVSGNRRHLCERGIVRDSGQRGLTAADRRAIKWELAQ